MTQNTSSAVMQQRIEPHDSLDFFPTPPWATRALCEFLINNSWSFGDKYPRDHKWYMLPDERLYVWEPACGQGHMARVLAEYFQNVFASDVFDYGYGEQLDFLSEMDLIKLKARLGGCLDEQRWRARKVLEDWKAFPWIITNPPFGSAEKFALLGLERGLNIALLVRTAFLETIGRYNRLFLTNPPTRILQFTERVPMIKGRLDKKASTATSYAWLVWDFHAKSMGACSEFVWIEPCRRKLEKPEDYA